MIKKIIKIVTKSLLLFAVISIPGSCKKEIVQPKEEGIQKIKIEALIAYYSKLVNVQPGDMIYNEKTEQFSIYGTDQISLKELTELYIVNHPKQ